MYYSTKTGGEILDKVDEFIKERKNSFNYGRSKVNNCLRDGEYEDTFPEDLIEERTDWQELRDRETTAQFAVDALLCVIDLLLEEREERGLV